MTSVRNAILAVLLLFPCVVHAAAESASWRAMMSETHRSLWDVEACCTKDTCPAASTPSFPSSEWYHNATVKNFRVSVKWNEAALGSKDEELLEKSDHLSNRYSGKVHMSDRAEQQNSWIGNAHVAGKIAALREIFAPSALTVSTVTDAFMGPSSTSGLKNACAFSYDTLECRNVPVLDLLSLLPVHVPICVLTSRDDKGGHRQHVSTVLTSENLAAAMGLSMHVALITGLTPFDYRSVATRHTSQQTKQSRQQSASSGPLTNNDDPHPRSWPVQFVSAPVFTQVSAGTTQSTQPLGVHVGLAVYCVDGSNATGFDPQYCSYSGTGPNYQPQTFNISMFSTLSNTTLYRSFQSSVSTCNSDFTRSSIGGYDQIIICTGTVYVPVTPMERLQWKAQTIFADISNAQSPVIVSAWATLKSYYDGKYGAEASVIAYSPTTPRIISQLYNVPFPYTGSNRSAGISVGILEFQNVPDDSGGYGGSLKSDVAKYLSEYSPISSWDESNLLLFDTEEVAQGETTLDASLVCGLLPNVEVAVENLLYGADTDYPTFGSILAAWAQRLVAGTAGPGKIHTTFSISWGGWEKYVDEFSIVDNYFRLLTLAGVTIVASTGDGGAVPYAPYATGPAVEFPASSSYVIAVGATARLQVSPDVSVEVACSSLDANLITSGGGYAVRSQPIPLQATFLPTGKQQLRGLPDVSAIGADLPIFLNGSSEVFYGTSASAPIFASLITMLNIERANAGQPPLRMIHTFLYNGTKNDPTLFNDVTVGNNCAGESHTAPFFAVTFDNSTPSGCYSAGPGWDAVTGLGTPNYPALLRLALQFVNPPEPILASTSPSTDMDLYYGIAAGGGVCGVIALVFVVRHHCKKRAIQGEFNQQYAVAMN